MPHTYYTSGAILHSTQEVEVALTILKLTGTGGQAGRQAGTSKYRDACASKNVTINCLFIDLCDFNCGNGNSQSNVVNPSQKLKSMDGSKSVYLT